MAKLPVIPLPNGGRVRLQPICVEDLVDGIELVLCEGRFEGEALDLGGPTPISLADFLRTTHRAFYGKEPLIFPLPLGPLRALLALAEPLLLPLLPVTAGQLAIFANDSTVCPNWLHDRLKPIMRSTEDTIVTLVSKTASVHLKTATRAPIALAPVDLDRECEIFSRYLVSQQPTAYIRKEYKAALIARDLANDGDFSAFDRRTLRLARHNVLFARFADAYCALFHRQGVLRRKLVLLLAILEHTAPTATRFDAPKSRGRVGVSVNLFLAGIDFGLSMIMGVLLLLPFHLFQGRS
jgi:hypothetical protein